MTAHEIEYELHRRADCLAQHLFLSHKDSIQKHRHLWVIAFEDIKTLLNTQKGFGVKVFRMNECDHNVDCEITRISETWILRLAVMKPYHSIQQILPLDMTLRVQKPSLSLNDSEIGDRILSGCCLSCGSADCILKCSKCKLARYCDKHVRQIIGKSISHFAIILASNK